ncbi:O-methyltransferase [Brevibacillus humidisoli]|uniref:O-methyltransferase n=1 Tax=Brevibacillus humidisoli TaxID=2895522 RepID=UPI001E31FE52|nr:O-methyltransferase [Brevibacillus humidisoli]UFJ42513.1 O-methyltransferase [Brevibacillus humidisoli]
MEKVEYIRSLFVGEDPVLADVLQTIKEKNMPQISVAPECGKLLTMLVRISGAKQILEIGALGGYSGICLLRGTQPDGRLTSLELEPEYAALAGGNLRRAGFGEQVTYLLGDALDSLARLKQEQKRFDFFFIDADKINYPQYLEWSIRLANPGALIVADNVLRNGRVIDETNQDPAIEALRTFNQQLADHPRLESLLIPIGDGLAVARVG